MTQGVIYYNRGTKCLIRLLVSRYTLDRCGCRLPVQLLSDDEELPRWFKSCWRDEIVYMDHDTRSKHPLVQKASLWRWAHYDQCIFLDSDTVVREDPSPIFEAISDSGFGTTAFSNWTCQGNRMRGRIEGWRGVVGDDYLEPAFEYPKGVNTGVVAWHRGSPFLEVWEKLTRLGLHHAEINGAPGKRLIDETACQVLLPHYNHTLLANCWNRSAKHDPLPIEQAKIIHYHGNKHTPERLKDNPATDLWARMYGEMLGRHAGVVETRETHGDRQLKNWLEAMEAAR